MSKKLVSFVLAFSMLMTVFCSGVGDVGISASAENGDFTYYFLAPDSWCNAEKGAANSDVGAYWWMGPEDRKPEAWPGFKMEPAPEVGENVFKVTMPNNSEVISFVFNAYVDAGVPQNPELAKLAYQTVDVDVEDENYDGMIYVLDLNANNYLAEFNNVIPEKGDWFTLDNYEDSYNYTTYKFDENKPTPPKPDPVNTPDTPEIVTTGDADYIINDSDNTAKLVKYYDADKVVTIPDIINDAIVTTIGAEAFTYCSQVEVVITSDYVTVIDSKAFYNCPNLKEVYLSNSVTEISKDAFENNKNIKIFASKDSYAAAYALENDIPFIDVNAVFGDMDGDNQITSADSLLILRRSVDLENFTDSQKFYADVDGDGNITSADALDVLRSSIKLISNSQTGKHYKRAA